MRHEWTHYQKNGPPIRCIAYTLGDANRPVPHEYDIWLTDADVTGVELLRLAERLEGFAKMGFSYPHDLEAVLQQEKNARENLAERLQELTAENCAFRSSPNATIVSGADRIAALEESLAAAGEARENAEIRAAELEEEAAKREGYIAAVEADRDACAAERDRANLRFELMDKERAHHFEEEVRLRSDNRFLADEAARLRADLREAIRTGEELSERDRQRSTMLGAQEKEINALTLQAHLAKTLLKPIQEHHQEGESALDTLVRCLREREEQAEKIRDKDRAIELLEQNRREWLAWADPMKKTLARLDALLASEEVPEGLGLAIWANVQAPRPNNGRPEVAAWRWIREALGGIAADAPPDQTITRRPGDLQPSGLGWMGRSDRDSEIPEISDRVIPPAEQPRKEDSEREIPEAADLDSLRPDLTAEPGSPPRWGQRANPMDDITDTLGATERLVALVLQAAGGEYRAWVPRWWLELQGRAAKIKAIAAWLDQGKPAPGRIRELDSNSNDAAFGRFAKSILVRHRPNLDEPVGQTLERIIRERKALLRRLADINGFVAGHEGEMVALLEALWAEWVRKSTMPQAGTAEAEAPSHQPSACD